MGVHDHIMILGSHYKEGGLFVGRTFMEIRFMIQNVIHTRGGGGGGGCNGEWHVDGSDIGFRSKNRHIPSLMNGQICIHRPESPRLCQVKPQSLTFFLHTKAGTPPQKENHQDRSAQTISKLKSEAHSSNVSGGTIFISSGKKTL